MYILYVYYTSLLSSESRHTCNVKEIHLMLDALKQLGLFFKYSPKRSRRLEVSVDEVNQKRCKSDQISKTKLSMFCETRWVEKHTTIHNV